MQNKRLLSVAEINELLKGKPYSTDFFVQSAGVSPATYYNLVHSKVNAISTRTQEKISDFLYGELQKLQQVLG